MNLNLRSFFRCCLLTATAGLTTSPGSADSILRSAGNFALLGGTGITSTGVGGTSLSNGNVGLSPGATTGITGFPPAVIINGAIVATGPVTAQARLDLIKAQVGLAGMPSNANMSTVDLGGKTLEPGVYTFDSEASLNGDLVLDGKGRNNAFWVFQIGTALTTSINSTVRVINPGSNGGKDYGIFWNCGSAINIGGDNEIAGIYLAGTSIIFGDGSTRGGRALALAAISLDNNQFDALGGPGGSDWSGGLMFDRTGRIVPIEKLSFSYFGKKSRVTDRPRAIIRGRASASATKIQWRSNQRQWRTVRISNNDNWRVKIKNLRMGGNRLRLRSLDADGNRTAIQRLTIRRVGQILLSHTSIRN
jgi:hypothetical protein